VPSLNLSLRPGQTAVLDWPGRAAVRLYARHRSGTRLHFAVLAPEEVTIRREDSGPADTTPAEAGERRSLSSRLKGVADRLGELSLTSARDRGRLNDALRALEAVRRDLVAPAAEDRRSA
jgi:hypothetical protein